MFAKGLGQQGRQELISIGLDGCCQIRIGLGELSRININLNHLAEGHELLPIEAGLLQA